MICSLRLKVSQYNCVQYYTIITITTTLHGMKTDVQIGIDEIDDSLSIHILIAEQNQSRPTQFFRFICHV